jgi:hypothetical protein
MIGMIQALAAIKWLAGIEEKLAGDIFIINGKTWRFTLANLSPPAPSYEISYSLLKEWMIKEPIQLIDIREPHDPGSLNKNHKIVVYCQTGKRSFAFMRQLRQEGFEAYSLDGGVSNNSR